MSNVASPRHTMVGRTWYPCLQIRRGTRAFQRISALTATGPLFAGRQARRTYASLASLVLPAHVRVAPAPAAARWDAAIPQHAAPLEDARRWLDGRTACLFCATLATRKRRTLCLFYRHGGQVAAHSPPSVIALVKAARTYVNHDGLVCPDRPCCAS